MKTKGNYSDREGAILGVIMIVMLVLTLLIMGLFHLGTHSARETEYALNRTQAFWLAEAGRQKCVDDLYDGGDGIILAETSVGGSVQGTFRVEDGGDNVRIAIGTVTVGRRTVTRRIRLELGFVASPFENAVYGGNNFGTSWIFQLRGRGAEGPILPVNNRYKHGGKDRVLGDVEINGDVMMAEESRVLLPSPNLYGVFGDVNASGNIRLLDSANITGSQFAGTPTDSPPDLADMNYADNNDYDVAQIFSDAGVISGRLPTGHPLRDVLMVEKNPPNRSEENATTTGDDFYFEPVRAANAGNIATGETPLPLGDDKVYYVDGHVWFHNKSTYGFKIDGQAAIISTRDIHVSDNLEYADRGLDGDMLALIALGQYTDDVYESAGNIYFGDPAFGTLYTADAFMFANNNFYYNTTANTHVTKQPYSGFKVFGNFMAANQVIILRDWYDINPSNNDGLTGNKVDWHPAEYDSLTGQWKDAFTGIPLTEGGPEGQLKTLRHYAMQVAYDERIRDASTQMSGLPQGPGTIFAGINKWEEIPPE